MIAAALRPRNGSNTDQVGLPVGLAAFGGFGEGQNLSLGRPETGRIVRFPVGNWKIGAAAGHRKVCQLSRPRCNWLFCLTPASPCRRQPASRNSLPSAPAAPALRSVLVSIDKFDAAHIPGSPHDMAALCRFEAIE